MGGREARARTFDLGVSDVVPFVSCLEISLLTSLSHSYYLFGKRGDYNAGVAYQKWFSDVLYIDFANPKFGVNSLPILPATAANGTKPQARAGASCAFDSTGKRVLCSGGEVNDTTLNPNPLFSMSAAEPTVGRWTESAASGPARDTSSNAVWAPVMPGSGNSLITFAGRYQAPNKTRDILDAELRAISSSDPFGTNVLQNSTAQGSAGPVPRIFHCVVQLDSDRILIGFGSNATGAALDDIWIYTLSKSNWTNIDTLASGTKPPAMSGPSCALDAKRNRVLVYGPGTKDRGQLSSLDLGTLKWTIETVPAPNPAALEPSVRWGATCDVVVDWMVCFGGYLIKADLFTYGVFESKLRNDISPNWHFSFSFSDVRPYFMSLVPSPQWQYAPVNLTAPIPDPTPAPSNGLSAGAIAGIVVASVIGVVTIVSAVVFALYRQRLKKKVEKGEMDPEEWEAQERGWK